MLAPFPHLSIYIRCSLPDLLRTVTRLAGSVSTFSANTLE